MSHPSADRAVPAHLAPRTRKLLIEDLALSLDIGFHDAEIGRPQRVLVTIEVWLEEAAFPATDDPADTWDQDDLKQAVIEAATARRYRLQESLARAIYGVVAAHRGVAALRIVTRKPDIYPDCAAAGAELASF